MAVGYRPEFIWDEIARLRCLAQAEGDRGSRDALFAKASALEEIAHSISQGKPYEAPLANDDSTARSTKKSH